RREAAAGLLVLRRAHRRSGGVDAQTRGRCGAALLLQDALGPHVAGAAQAGRTGDGSNTMTTWSVALSAAFAWIVPGGGYLLMRRYGRFAMFLLLVTATFAAGIALQGGVAWPGPDDLKGLDGLAALVARGGTIVKCLAGAPYVLAQLLLPAQT